MSDTVQSIVEQALRTIIESSTEAAVERVASSDKTIEAVGPAIIERMNAEISNMNSWKLEPAISMFVRQYIENHYADQIRAIIDAEWKRKVEDVLPGLIERELRRFVEVSLNSAVDEMRRKLYR